MHQIIFKNVIIILCEKLLLRKEEDGKEILNIVDDEILCLSEKDYNIAVLILKKNVVGYIDLTDCDDITQDEEMVQKDNFIDLTNNDNNDNNNNKEEIMKQEVQDREVEIEVIHPEQQQEEIKDEIIRIIKRDRVDLQVKVEEIEEETDEDDNNDDDEIDLYWE